MKKALLFLLLLSTRLIFAQWTNGQNAEYVIGQSNFTTYTSGTTTQKFSHPHNVAIDNSNHKMYVADRNNHRVLRFAYPITGNNPTAERIFGVTGSSGTSQNQLSFPSGVAVYNDVLWVSDSSNNRLLKFNNASTQSSDGPSADGVLGQVNYTSSANTPVSASSLNAPLGISFDAAGNLWVADMANKRALKYNNVNSKSNGDPADLVLGKPDMTSNTAERSQSGCSSVTDVKVEGATVWVADRGNNRVLRFDNPSVSGALAGGVLGQPNFTDWGVVFAPDHFYDNSNIATDAGGRLYVTDKVIPRVLIFNNASSKANGAYADRVIGQANLTAQSFARGGQNSFYCANYNGFVGGITIDPVNMKLLVCDYANNRVMQFSAASALPVELVSFIASANGGTVNLSWKTATEVNNYGFEVERKTASTWEKIGFVAGHGNSNSPNEYSYTDKPLSPGAVAYRLKQLDNDGRFEYSKEAEVSLSSLAFSLDQNYPNPFNPATSISYRLNANGYVTLKVYNALGEEVRTIVNEYQASGLHSAEFNATNLPAGIYYCLLRAGENTAVKKMSYLK